MYFHYQTLWRILKTSFSPRYFHPTHAIYVLIFVSLFLILHLLVSIVRQIDKIIYPRYHQQKISPPIYITGNPRSGTTFLHRLLSIDPQFTYTNLNHTIFPAISFYRFFNFLGSINRYLGGVLTKILNKLENRGFVGWENIHTTKLNQAEEDEQLFVFTLLSPVITLLFPFYEELMASCWVDKLPQNTRQKLMAHYYNCLQTHLYTAENHQTLLIKNTTSTGRLQSMLEILPDLKIIHIIRHPYEAIASLLSMYDASWRTFVPQTRRQIPASWDLAQLYANYYRYRLQLFEQLKRENTANFFEVRYEDLIANPLEVIQQIYQQFDLDLTETVLADFQTTINQQQKNYKSKHKYSLEQFGISKTQLYETMKDVFEAYDFKP